jgi:spore coat polysaccharide biosynthesis protein SpsF
MKHSKKPRIAIITQARMGSTRLPGKHLKKVLDKPLIAYLIERLRRVRQADELILATTDNPLDDELVDFAEKAGLAYFRGSEEDVLDRYYHCAKEFKADVIVRISADCPLIDPALIDAVIQFYLDHTHEYDYISNTLTRTYPRGMDIEVFSFDSFKRVKQEGHLPEEKEHVTPYYYRHPEKFRLGNFSQSENEASHRWTVDTEEDFKLISTILESIYPQNHKFTLKDLLDLIQAHPDWEKINAHIEQKKL